MATNPRRPRRNPNRSSTPRVAGRQTSRRGAEGPEVTSPAAAPEDIAADDVTTETTAAATDVDEVAQEPAREDETSTAATESTTADEAGDDEAGDDTVVADVAGPVETVEGESADADAVGTEKVEDDRPQPSGKRRVARVSTLRPGDPGTGRASTAADASTTATPGATSRQRAGGFGFGNRTLIVLGVVAGVLAVIALIGGLHPGAKPSDNRAFVDRAATTELTSQVQDKACFLTVTSTDVDKWARQARSALTGPALKTFDEYLPEQKKILGQTQAVADCRVESVGVADLNSDGTSARVLVNMIVSQQMAGLNGQSGAPRYQFAMVKRDDQWLINEVEVF